MYEVLIFLGSLFVALLAVRFDRWIGNKKELNTIISALGFEIVENISIAKTITKKAENEIKTFQTMQTPFAPMPTFSDMAYFRAKNSGIFLDFVTKNKSGVEKEFIKNLHECYNSMRLVNKMMESQQEVKVELMMQRCPKEKGEQISTIIKRTIQEAIEPSLTITAVLLAKIDPKLRKTISLLSETPSN